MVAGFTEFAHQLVPGRVEFHLVDPVAEAVMGAQLRLVAVGLARELLDMGGAGQRAAGFQRVPGPVGAKTFQGLAEGNVAGEGVVTGEIGCLVADFMRGVGCGMFHIGTLRRGEADG